MSTTVRISKDDKVRLERLAKKLNLSLTETLRYAIYIAEKEADKFRGDLNILFKVLKEAGNSGEKEISEKVNEELARILGED